jgi:hypothetical protein
VKYTKKTNYSEWLWLAIFLCAGCGATLDSSRYVYTPGQKLDNGIKPLPATVAITYLKDAREKERNENVHLIYLPLMPYARSHYGQPETEEKFAVKGLQPDKDFAHALMQEMEQNNLFKKVLLRKGEESDKAEFVVTGTINRASVDTVITSYGMSMFGIVPWALGLPEGKIYNHVDVHYEMRRVSDNTTVWKCHVKGEWSRVFGFYYNYSPDEPYTGMNVLLSTGLHNGLSLLAEDIKQKPTEWKH